MSESIKTRRPRPGRPIKEGAKADKPGLSSILSARISFDVRSALEKEADRSGHSISQVAERWLGEASKGQAEYLARMGGSADVAAMVEKIAEIARIVESEEPDRGLARIALGSALASALPLLVPHWVDGQAMLADVLLNDGAWVACNGVIDALVAADDNDPVVVRALQPLIVSGGPFETRTIEKLFHALMPADGSEPTATSNSLRILLRKTSAYAPGETTVLALRELRARGDTASVEIERALASIQDCRARDQATATAHTNASKWGRLVAESVVGRLPNAFAVAADQ